MYLRGYQRDECDLFEKRFFIYFLKMVGNYRNYGKIKFAFRTFFISFFLKEEEEEETVY